MCYIDFCDWFLVPLRNFLNVKKVSKFDFHNVKYFKSNSTCSVKI